MADASTFSDAFARVVRVASLAEQNAVLAAYPPASGGWTATSRVRLTFGRRVEEHLALRAEAGEIAAARFDVTAFAEPDAALKPAVGALDHVMQAALETARANGPLHPGAMPRFPVPSEAYPGQIAVPLALLAVDDAGRRGLYGPDRLAVLSWPAAEPVGVGDAPGFDPADWPPPRRGDWPPPAIRSFDRARLEGVVTRFGALWERLLSGHLADADDLYRDDEAAEAVALLALLDPPGMIDVYRALSPRFWAWLTAS